MALRVPKAIPILGEPYMIDFDPKMIETLNSLGILDEDEQNITFDKSLLLNPIKFEKTMLHEICHAWQHESGLYEILDEQAREMMAQSFVALVRGLFDFQFRAHLFDDEE